MELYARLLGGLGQGLGRVLGIGEVAEQHAVNQVVFFPGLVQRAGLGRKVELGAVATVLFIYGNDRCGVGKQM